MATLIHWLTATSQSDSVVDSSMCTTSQSVDSSSYFFVASSQYSCKYFDLSTFISAIGNTMPIQSTGDIIIKQLYTGIKIGGQDRGAA